MEKVHQLVWMFVLIMQDFISKWLMNELMMSLTKMSPTGDSMHFTNDMHHKIWRVNSFVMQTIKEFQIIECPLIPLQLK